MSRVLAGQRMAEADYSDIEEQLRRIFREIIFDPIIEVLGPHSAQVRAAARELRNAKSDPIVSAIRSGKIQYAQGVFSGEFSAATSKALKSYGAKFNKNTRTFAAIPESLPAEVLDAAAEYAREARECHDRLEARLAQVQAQLARMVDAKPVNAKKTMDKMDKDFNRHFGDALGTDGLSQGAKDNLAAGYEQSLKPYIKEFSDKMISELREMVAANAREGYRFDSLIERIQGRYDVSASKAAFLARQETGLFTSKVRAARFQDVGITHYIWRTAHDAEVRTNPHGGHRHLDGMEFSYDKKAPAQYMSCGEPCNPGEDFGCRCVSDPVIPSRIEEDKHALA